MDTIRHCFYVDGKDSAGLLPVALDKAIDELRIKSGLTLTINDVTIDRTPHGDGLWTYILKVNK
jgi:hypothetical protein